jgi:hypothetical protein
MPLLMMTSKPGVPMNSLDKIKTMAQSEADKSHRTMLVLNFSPFSPLDVVREWSQQARDSREFVCEVEPSDALPVNLEATAMTADQYLAAIKALGLATNREASAALGISIRQHQRIAHGEARVPQTVALLLLCLERQQHCPNCRAAGDSAG